MMIHIASWKEDNGITLFSRALEKREVEITIDYPLNKKHTFMHLDSKGLGCVTSLIDRIVSEYKYVYSKPKEFGIWGHSLGDLVLEGIELNEENNKVILYVGS